MQPFKSPIRPVLAAMALLAGAFVVATPADAQTTGTCFGERATINAVAGQLTVGTPGDDVIVGSDGPDLIDGGAGDDLICGKQGDDVVDGGDGDDRIALGKGDDVADGGRGADEILGQSGSDTIDGGRGSDLINGGSSGDVLNGGNSPDVIYGKKGDDSLQGNKGDDTLYGGSGSDLIEGGKHDDTLYGKSGSDRLFGNTGDDVLFGGLDDDECEGGDGTDEFSSCNEAAVTPEPTPPPNILLLIADDFGIESSACFEAASPAPFLASICDEAVVFDNVWSSPTCSPTRAGILTGRHSFRTGIGEQANTTNGLVIGATEWTLPRVLDAAESGYAHASFGKWHLGGDLDNPNTMGWSHFSGLFTGGLGDYEDWTKTVDGVQENVTTYATTEMVDDASALITAQDSPWFAWVAFNAPHSPWHLPPSDLHSQSLSGVQADIDANPEAYYGAAVEAMDTEVERLLGSIDPAELANTTIIFIGDNGTPNAISTQPNGRAKGTLHEGGVHVPMMIWGAGVDTPGRSDALVATMDLFTTILDIAGVDAAAEIPVGVPVDSVSVAPVLAGAAGERSTVMTEYFGTSANPARVGQAIRDDRYKLIDYTNGGTEFYDLVTDPWGQTPLGSLSAAEQAAFDELAAALGALNAS
ncbi:MAG: sulfatase-like hydrolase/transferase [Actinomycetota bacterium]